MADGRRYMIYYTFRPLPDRASTSEAGKSSAESGPDGEEQGNV